IFLSPSPTSWSGEPNHDTYYTQANKILSGCPSFFVALGVEVKRLRAVQGCKRRGWGGLRQSVETSRIPPVWVGRSFSRAWARSWVDRPQYLLSGPAEPPRARLET